MCAQERPMQSMRKNGAGSVIQGASTIASRPWKQQNKGRLGRLLLLLWARIQTPFSLGPAHLFPPAMSCSDPLHTETSPRHWKSLGKWSCVRTLLCLPSSSMPSQRLGRINLAFLLLLLCSGQLLLGFLVAKTQQWS